MVTQKKGEHLNLLALRDIFHPEARATAVSGPEMKLAAFMGSEKQRGERGASLAQ